MSPHGRSKPNHAETETLAEQCGLGLQGNILSQVLHGEESSMCPHFDPHHGGFFCIVFTTLFRIK